MALTGKLRPGHLCTCASLAAGLPLLCLHIYISMYTYIYIHIHIYIYIYTYIRIYIYTTMFVFCFLCGGLEASNGLEARKPGARTSCLLVPRRRAPNAISRSAGKEAEQTQNKPKPLSNHKKPLLNHNHPDKPKLFLKHIKPV